MTETEEPSPETEEKPTATPQATEQSTQVTETKPSQKQYICSVCGETVVPTPVKTDRGIRYQCPKCKKFMKPLTKEDLEERGVEYKGIAPSGVEARKFVVEELLARLDTVWGIATKKVKPIAATVEDNPQIALDPTALYWHIKQLASQANDYQLYLFVSGLFTKLREKGLLRQPTPMPVMGMPQTQQQTQPFPPMFPQQSTQQPFSPFMQFQQPQRRLPQTTEEFEDFSERKSRARRNEERAQEEHELRMAKIRKEIESMSKPKTEQSNIITIVEPIRDAEGKLVKDDKGNIVLRKITGPSDQIRSTTEDPESRFLNRALKYRDLFKSDLDETKLRTIIKEEQPKEEGKPLSEEDVKKAAHEAAANVLAATSEKEKEERRHRELLEEIKRSGGSKTMEGYKSDSYRFMGQATEHLATAIEKKEPIKVIMDGARDLMGTAPPEKNVEAEAKEGIFKRVKKEFVAEE